MKALSESAAKLKAQIEGAFGDSKPPSILEHEGMFEDEERLDVMHALYRRKWQDIRCEAIASIGDSVGAFLVPEAFAYYLPALMICSLDFFNSDFIGDVTVQRLIPPDGAEDAIVLSFEESFEERSRLFTQEQCRVIHAFLEYLLLEYIIPYETDYVPSRTFVKMDRALEYWSGKF